MHLDGCVESVVNAVNVSIGKTGVLIGELIATHVTVSGRVDGKIRCDLLELLNGCQVHGEVQCHDLVVEKGAKFIGSTCEAIEGTVLATGQASVPIDHTVAQAPVLESK